MLLLDVNVCVYAFRRESRGYEDWKDWLEQALRGPEPVGLPEQVLASVLRLVTNHRMYKNPSTPEAALAFCDALLGAPAAIRVRPGERHWGIFHGLVSRPGLRDSDLPGAHLAPPALAPGATFVHADARSPR